MPISIWWQGCDPLKEKQWVGKKEKKSSALIGFKMWLGRLGHRMVLEMGDVEAFRLWSWESLYNEEKPEYLRWVWFFPREVKVFYPLGWDKGELAEALCVMKWAKGLSFKSQSCHLLSLWPQRITWVSFCHPSNRNSDVLGWLYLQRTENPIQNDLNNWKK